MDNYKEYIEERLIGMQTIIEASDNVLLEEFKKKNKEGKRSEFKKAFIDYLVFKYEDQDIQYAFKNAKTDKEKEALIKKYSKDFDEWRKRQKGLMAVLGADVIGIGATAAGAPGVGMLMSMLAWGGIIGTLSNDYKARDKAREEKYLEKNKK